tara:strand:+ start:411 stop:659 length:249 start_codon:yes stop_codon:yes gene_type:complete
VHRIAVKLLSTHTVQKIAAATIAFMSTFPTGKDWNVGELTLRTLCAAQVAAGVAESGEEIIGLPLGRVISLASEAFSTVNVC